MILETNTPNDENNNKIKYKEYYKEDYYFKVIILNANEIKIIIYNIKLLDNIKYNITINKEELYRLSPMFTLYNNIDELCEIIAKLIEHNKFKIIYKNNKIKLIFIISDMLSKNNEIEILLESDNEQNEYLDILSKEILKIKNKEINELKEENKKIKEEIQELRKIFLKRQKNNINENNCVEISKKQKKEKKSSFDDINVIRYKGFNNEINFVKSNFNNNRNFENNEEINLIKSQILSVNPKSDKYINNNNEENSNKNRNKYNNHISNDNNNEIKIKIKAGTNNGKKLDKSIMKNYPIITDLIKIEKSLDEMIPNFNNLILKNETQEEINSRIFFLRYAKYTQNISKKCSELSDLMNECKISHPDLMMQIFNEYGFKNLPKINYNLEDEIFEKSKIDEINAPIGVLENFDSFLKKYRFTDLKLIEKCKKSFNKWRRVLGEGNSFYRVLMFCIFEKFILDNNLSKIKMIVSEITYDDLIIIYKQNKINYNICFIILSTILYFLQMGNKLKAYKILLKSYLLIDFSFDKMLIIYLKYIISLYIKQLKEKMKKTEKNKTINNLLNLYMIESPYIEPSFLVINIIPYLFDINISILYISGELINPINSTLNLMYEEGTELPTITLGYFFSSYFILYPPDFEIENKFKLKVTEKKYNNLTYIFKDSNFCDVCLKKTSHIFFIEKKFIICKNCLENHLNIIFNNRSNAFKKDEFIGFEYYSRPIHMFGNYYINDFEIIELLESLNIINVISK